MALYVKCTDKHRTTKMTETTTHLNI